MTYKVSSGTLSLYSLTHPIEGELTVLTEILAELRLRHGIALSSCHETEGNVNSPSRGKEKCLVAGGKKRRKIWRGRDGKFRYFDR